MIHYILFLTINYLKLLFFKKTKSIDKVFDLDKEFTLAKYR